MTDEISNEIKEFTTTFKNNIVDLKTYLIIIPVVAVAFVFRKYWTKYLLDFFGAIPTVVMGIFKEPIKYSMAFFIILMILLIVIQTYYLTTGKGISYFLYKLNLL